MAYKCFILKKIKLDALGNKVSCIIEKSGLQYEYTIADAYKAFKSGVHIKNAIDINGELGITSTNGSFQDLTGLKINDWLVIEYLGNKYWRCICSCGAIKAVAATSLLENRSQNCGHERLATRDLTGQIFGDWKVLEYCGPSTRRWKCQCIRCGKIKERLTDSLYYNHNTKCDCNDTKHSYNFIDLTGQKFGLWTVIGLADKRNRTNTYWQCVCDCDKTKIHEVAAGTLLSGASTSCGCQSSVSTQETYIAEHIKQSGIEIITNSRKIIPPKELDIYIPDKKLAIEFNGIRWHNEAVGKDKNYHLNKTKYCNSQGIRLIHIFDYEWRNARKQSILLDLIDKSLGINTTVIYARNTEIKLVSTTDARDFLNKNHLQGYIPASDYFGLYSNNQLIELMTFGAPRYDKSYQYELLRLCTVQGIRVVGGASKLFKHFIKLYSPDSIISYCDRSKFTGEVYKNIGMSYVGTSEPSYIYTNGSYNSILSRTDCMKHKLLAQGLGTPDMTEKQIMAEYGYSPVYDCGTLKYEYRKG